VKDYVAEATNRLCAETGEADGSTARDSVTTGFNATWVCAVLGHTHKRFTSLFLGLPEWAGARRNILLDFVVQGKTTDVDTPTIRLGATPSGLISNPPPSSSHFTLDALPGATLSIYPGLGTGIKYAGLIPSGLVCAVLAATRTCWLTRITDEFCHFAVWFNVGESV